MDQKIIDYIFNQHDIVCNQKYDEILPYSFHLKTVLNQGIKFLYLIDTVTISNNSNQFSKSLQLTDVVKYILLFHDSIEDARITYNDIMNIEFGNNIATKLIADTVYRLTDEKGKSRLERKNDKYYNELSENDLAVFAKLADISANTLYSKLTQSSMYDKYKKEFSLFKEKTYKEKFKDFFDYVENL